MVFLSISKFVLPSKNSRSTRHHLSNPTDVLYPSSQWANHGQPWASKVKQRATGLPGASEVQGRKPTCPQGPGLKELHQ